MIMINWMIRRSLFLFLMGTSIFIPSLSARWNDIDYTNSISIDASQKGVDGVILHLEYHVSNMDTVGKEKVGRKLVSLALGRSYLFSGRSLGRKVEGGSNDYEKYISRNIVGIHFGVSYRYYFPSNFGIGATYNHFRFNDESLNQQYVLADSTFMNGDFRNRIRLDYLGLNVYYYLETKRKKLSMDMGLGLGYLKYKDKQTVIYTYDVLGKSIGGTSEIAVNYKLNKKISFSFAFLWVTGTLWSYDVVDGNGLETVSLSKEKYEDIARENIIFKVNYLW